MAGGQDARGGQRLLIPGVEVALLVAGCAAMLWPLGSASDGSIQLTSATFLIALVAFFGRFVVRLDRGYLRLTMIGTQAAAMVLAPPLAGLIGLIAGLSWFRNGPDGYRYLGVGATVFWTSSAALLRIWVGSGSGIRTALGFVLVAAWMTFINWAHTLGSLSLLTGEPIRQIASSAFRRPFLAAFAYFSLAAILIASVIDGSLRGYFLGAVVAVLSVTLTETLVERRHRAALEEQVADGQRYVGYSRALEGVVHSLRHQLAISKGYLEDLLEARLAIGPRGRAQGAKASTDVALQILDRLQASASPRVVIAGEPVSLRAVAMESIDLVRGRAAARRARVELTGKVKPLTVSGDPSQLREVVTELLINALDAANDPASIVVSVSRRSGGWVALSVADNGPGIGDSQREHLFEPHFTTKPEGTGMGLFTAFGVLREHQGKLVYEGSKRGGVFTILIPRSTSGRAAKPIAEAGDGLNPAMVPERLSR